MRRPSVVIGDRRSRKREEQPELCPCRPRRPGPSAVRAVPRQAAQREQPARRHQRIAGRCPRSREPHVQGELHAPGRCRWRTDEPRHERELGILLGHEREQHEAGAEERPALRSNGARRAEPTDQRGRHPHVGHGAELPGQPAHPPRPGVRRDERRALEGRPRGIEAGQQEEQHGRERDRMRELEQEQAGDQPAICALQLGPCSMHSMPTVVPVGENCEPS